MGVRFCRSRPQTALRGIPQAIGVTRLTVSALRRVDRYCSIGDRALAIAEKGPELVALLIEAADHFVAGRFRFFGYPPVMLTEPINWHHDPMSDVSWPDLPSNRIDHRVAGGDVKWIWELNRLQHLPVLAQAWLLAGERRYSRTAFAHLDTWIDQNPPGRGIAWRVLSKPDCVLFRSRWHCKVYGRSGTYCPAISEDRRSPGDRCRALLAGALAVQLGQQPLDW